MSTVLTHNAYGKSQVRLTRVTRHADRHDLKELCVWVQLEGDFALSYLRGDNSQVIPTDTIKNTVYILAKKHGVAAVESFGETLAAHFLQTYGHVSAATINLHERPWKRLVINGQNHPHAFIGEGEGENRKSTVTLTRQTLHIETGFDELPLLKTTDSAFAGFIHDEYTTLKDADDRILATLLSARWEYAKTPVEWDDCHRAVREALVGAFARHKSLAVQQTLNAMAEAALEACAAVKQITLTMPNRHHILVNLEPFGLENKNEVFVATQEPYGVITGTVRRTTP